MAVNRRGLKLACFFCKKICPCFSRYLFIVTLEGLKRPPLEALGKLLPDGWFAEKGVFLCRLDSVINSLG